MKIAAKPRDVEKLVVDYLTDALQDSGCTVGTNVPDRWTPASTPHVQVVGDGDPFAVWPIATYPTVRLVARASTNTATKDLCALAFGMLLAHNGDERIAQTRYLTGVLAAVDPQTGVDIAAATARVTVRTELIESGS